MNQVPAIVDELISFINRLPPNDAWKRLRVAVTDAEAREIVAYYLKDSAQSGANFAALSIRGVPLVIEDKPTEPKIYVVGQ